MNGIVKHHAKNRRNILICVVTFISTLALSFILLPIIISQISSNGDSKKWNENLASLEVSKTGELEIADIQYNLLSESTPKYTTEDSNSKVYIDIQGKNFPSFGKDTISLVYYESYKSDGSELTYMVLNVDKSPKEIVTNKDWLIDSYLRKSLYVSSTPSIINSNPLTLRYTIGINVFDINNPADPQSLIGSEQFKYWLAEGTYTLWFFCYSSIASTFHKIGVTLNKLGLDSNA